MKSSFSEVASEWIVRLNKSQVGHFIAYEKFNGVNRNLSIGAVLFSTITSGMLLFDFDASGTRGFSIIVLTTSILAALCSSLQMLLSFDQRAENHKSKATKYGALKRKLELAVIEDPESYKSLLMEVEKEWTLIADDSPVTPRKFRSVAKEVLAEDREDNQQFTKKNINS